VNWGLFFVFFAQTFLTPFLIPQWLRGSVILMGQVSKHTNLSPINTAFQCLLLCVHFSLTPFICFLSCLSFCGDLLQYSGLGDWMRCQRLVSSEHPEQMPYTNKLKRQPRRPQKKKKNTLTLSLTSPAILTLKSPKASECAAGTAGRPHPKANLDRWCAKQHSTSGHVSTFCCSFPNPTLNGSSLSLLAEIQVLLHMDVTQKCNGYFPPSFFLFKDDFQLQIWIYVGSTKGLLQHVQIC